MCRKQRMTTRKPPIDLQRAVRILCSGKNYNFSTSVSPFIFSSDPWMPIDELTQQLNLHELTQDNLATLSLKISFSRH